MPEGYYVARIKEEGRIARELYAFCAEEDESLRIIGAGTTASELAEKRKTILERHNIPDIFLGLLPKGMAIKDHRTKYVAA